MERGVTTLGNGLSVFLYDEYSNTRGSLDYSLVENIVIFSYRNIDYNIDFGCEGASGDIRLRFRPTSECYWEYKLIIRRDYVPGFRFSYYFDSIDLADIDIAKVVISRNGDKYKSDCNITSIIKEFTNGSCSYESISVMFRTQGTLGNMLRCFDFSKVDYNFSGRVLQLGIKGGYLVISNEAFIQDCTDWGSIFTCYKGEYNWYEYYMFTIDPSRDYLIVHYKVIVKNCKIMYSIGFSSDIVAINKRIL